MSERNTNMWGFTGILGLVISVGLLLAILVVFTWKGIVIQQASASNPYDSTSLRDINNLKKVDVNNEKYSIRNLSQNKDAK